MPEKIGFLGGTGPEGRGLAVRFAAAGHDVVIGSRSAERASEAVARVLERLSAVESHGAVTGGANRQTAEQSEIVFLTVPYAGQQGVLEETADTLAGKICVNVVAPLQVEDGVPHGAPPPAGSAAEEAAAQAPGVRWVAGLHTLSARDLLRVSAPMDTDALICGNDAEAVQRVMELTEQIPGLRAVNAGSLKSARYLEGATALLININRVYKSHASLRVAGI